MNKSRCSSRVHFIIIIYIYIITYIFLSFHNYGLCGVPDAIFSTRLHKYARFCGTDEIRTGRKIQYQELADQLTKGTKHIVTVQVVAIKLKRIRYNLRRLDSRKSTSRTPTSAHLWYAQKLGLKRAVQTMTDQLIGDGKIRIVTTDDGDFLGFDETDAININLLSDIDKLLE